MEDEELQAIRQARLAELQRSGGNAAGPQGSSGSSPAPQDDKTQALIAQILTNEARERLSMIRIVKQERATAVESLLIRMAQSGQVQHKITEPELVSLLEQIQGPQGPKIVYSRRDEDDIDLGPSMVSRKGDEEDGDDDFFD